MPAGFYYDCESTLIGNTNTNINNNSNTLSNHSHSHNQINNILNSNHHHNHQHLHHHSINNNNNNNDSSSCTALNNTINSLTSAASNNNNNNNNNQHHNSSSNTNGIEGQRALQLALELSMLGLMNEDDDSISAGNHNLAHHGSHHNSNMNSVNHNFEIDARTKKSQNTTECVPVPSSEHVAEIVGRQGCKIKALRAKTNTYIKTPVRGEEPVFVVTGRKEDVNAAKKEILSAAEHFSQIRAQRKSNLNGGGSGGLGGLGPNPNLPGQMTIQVRVPYRVVGLVVGPKGATIKRIQQETNTYIITPSRDKEPIFEVTGLPENVEKARKEIESHIAIRTGGIIDSTTGATSSSTGTSSSSSEDSESSSREFLNDSPLFNAFSSSSTTTTATTNGFGGLSGSELDSDLFSAFSSTNREKEIISPSILKNNAISLIEYFY